MARHNREARGVDQRGELWIIGYQPDWLSRVKISRKLPRGRRRSRLTIFRNPARQAQMDVVESIIVVTRRGKRKKEKVEFVLQGCLPPSGKR
jgi:hypothetical protein